MTHGITVEFDDNSRSFHWERGLKFEEVLPSLLEAGVAPFIGSAD